MQDSKLRKQSADTFVRKLLPPRRRGQQNAHARSNVKLLTSEPTATMTVTYDTFPLSSSESLSIKLIQHTNNEHCKDHNTRLDMLWYNALLPVFK